MPNENLIEEVLKPSKLRTAWQAVKANRGRAGIDAISIEEFETKIRPHWAKISQKLLEDRYKPSPVKRVLIPKGQGETRALGIPTVLDRVSQQSLHQVLEPIFEPHFSEYSYGFRPKRRAHDAIKQTDKYLSQGKDWVVDIDLKSFFDEVNRSQS